MTLRWIDGFDHYATAQIDEMGYSISGAGNNITANGRFGTSSHRILNETNWFSRTFDQQATWIVGFAWHQVTWVNYRKLVAFLDGTTLHVDLRCDNTGHLYVTRNGTQLGSTGTSVLATGQYYYIEIKVTIHDSAGVVEVRINGVAEITLSAQDTRNAGNASANIIEFANGAAGSGTAYYDDLYICDGVDASGTQGAAYNDFQGDLRIETIMPSGDGNSSQLVGSDGNSVNNSLLVDEATPNDDTDYVESSTVGDKDTYAYGNLSSSAGSIKAVMPAMYARKTDAGVRSIASIARLSATEVDSATQTLNSTYNYFTDLRTTKPGGGAWSISDVNSAEFGVKVTA